MRSRVLFNSYVVTFAVALLAGCSSNASKTTEGNGPPGDVKTHDIEINEPKDATINADALQPMEMVSQYFDLLHEGRGPEGVRRFWDTQELAERLFKDDFEQLSQKEKAEIATELKRFLMGLYANPRTAELMKQMEIRNVSEERNGESSIITFSAAGGSAQPPNAQKFHLMKKGVRWRFVDMTTPETGELMSRVIYLIYKSTGDTPLQHVRGMTAGLPTINEIIDAEKK